MTEQPHDPHADGTPEPGPATPPPPPPPPYGQPSGQPSGQVPGYPDPAAPGGATPPPAFGQEPYQPSTGTQAGQQWGQQPGQQPGQPWGQQPPQQWGPPAYPPTTPAQEMTWGSAAHWSALVAAFVALAFLGPLIVMLTEGTKSAWVRANAVEALNFQLSILIYGIVSFVLCFVIVGFLLLPVVGIAWLVCTILGAVKASKGEFYRYPLTIRMVS